MKKKEKPKGGFRVRYPEAIRLLGVSKPTLRKWIADGRIRVEDPSSRVRELNDEDVLAIKCGLTQRKVYLYTRIDVNGNQTPLDVQLALLNKYCVQNGIVHKELFTDQANCFDYSNRVGFNQIINDIAAERVSKLLVTDESVLGLAEKHCFEALLSKGRCELVILSNEQKESYVRNINQLKYLPI